MCAILKIRKKDFTQKNKQKGLQMIKRQYYVIKDKQGYYYNKTSKLFGICYSPDIDNARMFASITFARIIKASLGGTCRGGKVVLITEKIERKETVL